MIYIRKKKTSDLSGSRDKFPKQERMITHQIPFVIKRIHLSCLFSGQMFCLLPCKTPMKIMMVITTSAFFVPQLLFFCGKGGAIIVFFFSLLVFLSLTPHYFPLSVLRTNASNFSSMIVFLYFSLGAYFPGLSMDQAMYISNRILCGCLRVFHCLIAFAIKKYF